ncbi:MAG: hypothetical protein ACRBHB_17315 [Arenicella sp.]
MNPAIRRYDFTVRQIVNFTVLATAEANPPFLLLSIQPTPTNSYGITVIYKDS